MQSASLRFEKQILKLSWFYEFPPMFGNRQRVKFVPFGTRNLVLPKLGFTGCSIFRKNVVFKVVTVVNFIYTVGIAATLRFCYTGRIHIKIGSLITKKPSKKLAYNPYLRDLLKSGIIIFFILVDLGTKTGTKGGKQFAFLSYGFCSIIYCYLMLAISPFFGLKLDPVYYFLSILKYHVGFRGKISRMCIVLLQGDHWTFGSYIVLIIAVEFISLSANTLNSLVIRKNLNGLKYRSIIILVTYYNQLRSDS
ncbi:hypothetical protein Fcan01_15686 [Folsomia candida]|uniref:Uncharacterized protein n=1 Tax=Folsomia candida TaxID=158441 RepID=A0A226DXJ6_FOLCA|nr:hypothetical protein Fcan01_15686 [Folsomia candida]